jgi:hypothetical protein
VRGILVAKVADSVDNAGDGTGKGVAGPGVADNFATDTVFLGSKRESNKRNAIQIGDITGERIKAIVANEELDIAETKGVAFTRTAVLRRR